MWFFQNPEIIFYYFFRIFNLDIFLILILQKYIGSRYLVPLTPPTVFGRFFWNFTGVLRRVKLCMWFFQNPEINFYYFLDILNIDIFWVLILQKCLGSRYLVPLTPPTVFGRFFWNFTGVLRMVWRCACVFSSPELKAQGELLWSLTVRRRRCRPYVRPSVHNL